MSEVEDDVETSRMEPEVQKKPEGQVTLAQMLKVLDKDVASGVEKRLKKLTKKKAYKATINEQEVAQLNRKAAYDEAIHEVEKWEPIVELNRQSNLSFPLDVEPDHLPTTAESVLFIKPRTDLEREIQFIIDESRAKEAKAKEQKKTDERYRKAISADEAKERHLELQKTRLRLSEYAAKMRRQNKIKSKSYHRLLKQERIKKHLKKVETNKDALMEEIERLQKIRAQERATLKHKNTGKWAKHAKFRAKYDEEARKLMLEQIGLASKNLEKHAMPESDSDEYDDDDDDDDSSSSEEDVDEVGADSEDEESDKQEENQREDDDTDRTVSRGEASSRPVTRSVSKIISSDPVTIESSRKRKKPKTDEALIESTGDGDDLKDDYDHDDDDDDDDDEAEVVQRKLMSEAFANDDVVGEFQKTKDQMVDEEQPKDIDTYLPGWNDWAGPGIEIDQRKRERFVKKAKKVDRRDETLNNVIISERANDSIRELQPKQLPRGIRNDEHMRKILSKPVTSTFTDQSSHRQSIQPKIVTRMGARIEPINKRVLTGGGKANWI